VCELTCPAWRERPLYWSTIAYVRVWWATDGVRLAIIREHGMQPDMLRSLGAEYNVNRSIIRQDRRRGAEDANARDVCETLHEAALRWPDDLLGHAEVCVDIAARMQPYTPGSNRNLVSAATKFMWFLKPDGWTVFDRFAAGGMGVAGHLSRVEQLRCFYHRLHDAGFGSLVAEMQAFIKKRLLPDLPSARILDTLLMARGGRGGDTGSIERLNAFLALLPATTRKPLEALARKLQRRFGSHPLASALIPECPE
jgi:hypothetical protein